MLSKHYGALKSFDFVVKVVERCNLACPYCYYFYQDFDSSKKFPSTITDEVINEVPKFLLRSVKALGLEKILVSLHGGEPTLMKKSRFDLLCGKIRESLDDQVELKISIQSNGVAMDDEWIDLFVKHKVNVGISLDGTQEVHDRFRIDRKGKGSYLKAVRALHKLQEQVAQGADISVGVIAVLSETERDAQLTHLIDNLNVVPNLNYPRGGVDTSGVSSWNHNLEAQNILVDTYLAKYVNPRFHYVRGLSEFILPMLSEKTMIWSELMHAKSNFVATISSNGKLMVDDNVLGVDSSKSETELTIYGNNSLADLVHSVEWQQLNQSANHLPFECGTCQWKRICKGGHVFNRYTPDGTYLQKSALCETLKSTYSKSYDYAVNVLEVDRDELDARLARDFVFSPQDAYEVISDENLTAKGFQNQYTHLLG